MRWIHYLCVLALGVAVTMLGVHNSESVRFSYVYGVLHWPLIALLLLAFSAGALMTLLVFGFKTLFWRARAKSLGKQLKEEHSAADDVQVRAEFQADRSAS